MKPIIPPLKPGDDNENVANLKAGLQLLIEKEQIDIPAEKREAYIAGLQKEAGYREVTREVVAIFQQQHRVKPTGAVDRFTATLLNKVLTPFTELENTVAGYVYTDYGTPANNVELRLYLKGFGGEDQLVNKALTDPDGNYQVPFNLANIPVANLEVRAVDAAGKEHILSETLYNAGEKATASLNLIAPTQVLPVGETEYARLSKDLTGVLGDLRKLTAAKEEDDRQDITYLSKNTNWDARAIALASIAASLSETTQIPHDAAYALVRAGLPHDLDKLAQVSLEDVNQAFDRAAKAGIVNLDDAQRKAAVASFRSFANTLRLNTRDQSSLSTYGEFLSQELNPGQQQAFASAYFAPRKDASELWDKVKAAGIPEDKIRQLQLQGKLGFLTANNAPLTRDLQGQLAGAGNLAVLVDQELYEPEAWDARLKTLAGTQDDNAEELNKLIPPSYEGATVADRKQAYVEDMADKVRTAYPEKVTLHRIQSGKMALGEEHTKIAVSIFLDKAQPLGYQLGSTQLDAFAARNQQALFSGMDQAQQATTIEGMKLLQRVHQVTPNDEAMQVVLEMGLKSAQDVMAMPEAYFIDRFEQKYLEKYPRRASRKAREIGKLVFNKSHQVQTTTYSFFNAVQQQQATPPVFAIGGSAEKREAQQQELADKIKGFPNLQQLFGSLDFCACEHCRSVLSPAAYLVDLLQFLDPKENEWTYFLDKWAQDHGGVAYTAQYTKPFEALDARRPDLAQLPLSCENTNTALPYIDIVNEILEYYLVHKNLHADLAHDTGNATTTELLAEPQHIEPEAYGTLKQAKYPLSLPFDLWLETVRQFCDQYATPLWEVMASLQALPADNFDATRKIAVEALRISPAEYAVFTRQDPLPHLPALYGFDTEALMVAELKSAKKLAGRLGVSYKELLSLVKTRFINPNLDILVLLQKMGVEVNDVFRFNKAAGFEPFNPGEQKAFEDKLDLIQETFGTDAKTAIEKAWTENVFTQVLLLNDTNAACNFEATTVGYADRDALPFDWLRFNLFVRLWKKLKWPIEEVDRALEVFLPKNLLSLIRDPAQPEADRCQALASGLSSALIQLAHFQVLTARINAGKQARLKLSTLWADLPVSGKNSLYAQLFLTHNILKIDGVFDDALGRYLEQGLLIKDHSLAVQAALNLTAPAIDQILKDDGQDMATAVLTLANVSLLYRYSLLAKGLKLSVPELITLKQLSGLNPFTPLADGALSSSAEDHLLLQTLAFADDAVLVKESGFRLEDLQYLFLHRFDPTGKYRNTRSAAQGAVKALAEEIRRIEAEHALPANPADPGDLSPFAAFTDEVVQQKLALALPAEVAQTFGAMWTGRQAKDWELVKTGMGDLMEETTFDLLFATVPEEADDSTKQQKQLEKRAALARALLPYIQQKLIAQALIQVLSTATGAEQARISWMIQDTTYLKSSDGAVALAATFAQAADPAKSAVLEKDYILLAKVQQLAEGFALSDRELQYFIAHPQDFADLDLSLLPLEENGPEANAQALFQVFTRLANYAGLRRDLAGGADDLIPVFARARRQYAADADEAAVKAEHLQVLYGLVATLSRRDPETVRAVAEQLGMEAQAVVLEGKLQVRADSFADERGLLHLWKALRLIQTFGISIQALAEAGEITSPGLAEEKCQALARNFKNAVKARYEPEAWQQIAQPIFDKLRQSKRNALVAYLLHTYQDLFGSLEEMYEYFLVDPGMEPVVQTSRIRIATASVQLFIQRCLLNLENRWEAKVPPGAINARHWQWMNRYRVWEANRKIFLFPENWLEPEWRDDKTHLFGELEGKLLQGDVSNDLVEDAFYGYLKKLEELARLDIVAMYCEEDPISPQANKLHVIGRTFSLPHKYFYRRYAQQMWTPWEPVETEIDGNHVVVIRWRGRLHLFWVTFLEKINASAGPAVNAATADTNLGDWKVGSALSSVTTGVQTKVMEAYLHWSEYYQGQWTTRQSGALDKPISCPVSLNTFPKDIAIYITLEPKNPIDATLDGAVHINLPQLDHAFRITNKNTPPEIISPDDTPTWPYQKPFRINRIQGDAGPMRVQFQHYLKTLNGDTQVSDASPQTILNQSVGQYSLLPSSGQITMGGADFGPLVTPFFYQDSAHTFYVEPALTETVTIDTWSEWLSPPISYEPIRPDWEHIMIDPIIPWPKEIPIPDRGDPGWIDLEDERIKISPKTRQDWTTNPDTYIKFGDRVIGKDKGLDVFLLQQNKARVQVKGNSLFDALTHNGTHAGSIILVPPGSSGKSAGGEMLGSIIATNSVGIPPLNATTLIGGGGLFAFPAAGNKAHLPRIFNGTTGIIKNGERFNGGF